MATNILSPLLDYVGTRTTVKFKGSCLKQDKISFDHGKIVNIYIVYKINKNFKLDSYPMLGNCLFGAVKLKNILILISTNILDMVLDLIEKDLFHLVMNLVKLL